MRPAILRHLRRELLGILAAITLLPLAALPWAGRVAQAEMTTAEAEAVVNALAEQVWSTFARADLNDQERIDALAAQLVAKTDVTLLSRLVLGRHWNDLDDEQKVRYQALFGDVVMRTFAGRLNQFGKGAQGSIDQHFSLASSAPTGRGDVLVRSTVRPESGDSLSVDWRLREGDHGPVIIDVIIAGVSLLVSQRSEFAAVLKSGGLPDLISSLEHKIQELAAAG